MGISFTDMTACGSIVSDLFAIAWVAIPFGMVAALGRYRQRAAPATTLGLDR
jgi:hypothetical protein